MDGAAGLKGMVVRRLSQYLSPEDARALASAMRTSAELEGRFGDVMDAARKGPRMLLHAATASGDTLAHRGLEAWYTRTLSEMPAAWIDPEEFWMSKV